MTRLKFFLSKLLLAAALASSCAHAAPAWPEWRSFSSRFIQADGRVVDLTFERKSTSEGQAYALFFALVANERTQFDTVLQWTSNNLASGQLGDKLPAWHWGVRSDGSWGVKDPNSASDADLWLAYTLMEAARLWNAPAYAATGRKLLAQVRRFEVAQAGSVGPVLLPGAIGFVLDKGRFHLNPSYLPGFMFRYLAVNDPQGPWEEVWSNHLRMTPALYAAGVAPDNFVLDSSGRVLPDTERTPSSSYDAIRVYLWAGMSGTSAPGNRDMLKRLGRFAELTRQHGNPPEKVNPLTGVATKTDYSPIGYSGAVLPYLSALGDKPTLERQTERVRAALANPGPATNYYDQVLILFGKGWLDDRYRFDDLGQVQPRWAR